MNMKLSKIGFIKLCLNRSIDNNKLIKNVVVEKDIDNKYCIPIAV
ncbi:hypothetical protein [Borreliella mayonii]